MRRFPVIRNDFPTSSDYLPHRLIPDIVKRHPPVIFQAGHEVKKGVRVSDTEGAWLAVTSRWDRIRSDERKITAHRREAVLVNIEDSLYVKLFCDAEERLRRFDIEMGGIGSMG